MAPVSVIVLLAFAVVVVAVGVVGAVAAAAADADGLGTESISFSISSIPNSSSDSPKSMSLPKLSWSSVMPRVAEFPSGPLILPRLSRKEALYGFNCFFAAFCLISPALKEVEPAAAGRLRRLLDVFQLVRGPEIMAYVLL